jgi:hypothetical protein
MFGALMENKKLVGFSVASIILITLLALYAVGDYSVFFHGGVTKGLSIDADGLYGNPNSFVYADGTISSNSFGAVFWELKPQQETDFIANDARSSVIINTQPNICKAGLKQVDNPLDPVNAVVAGYNFAYGKDYKIYKPSTWSRQQKVDVVVLGPDKQDLAAGLKQSLDISRIIPTAVPSLQRSIQDAAKTNGHTFDAYEDDVVQVGPFRIMFKGTTQGASDCGAFLVDQDTIILYSEKEDKVLHLDRQAIDDELGKFSVNTVTSNLGSAIMRVSTDFDSEDLEGKQIDVSGGSLYVVNDAPGKIELTIVAPTTLYYSPITGDVDDTDDTGDIPIDIDFGGFGEPAPCEVSIRDVAFSGDNSNIYEENDVITTYVKVENKGNSECLLSVTGKADYATAESKTSISLGAYQTKNVPIPVRFGAVTSTTEDTMTYKACSSSVVEGTVCDERDVRFTVVDTDATPSVDQPLPSPEPEPELSCEERSMSKTCGWNDFGCELGKRTDAFFCNQDIVPLLMVAGFGGIITMLVGIGLILVIWKVYAK